MDGQVMFNARFVSARQESLPSAPAIRTRDARRILRRSPLARVVRHGFAPDLEHGPREIGHIYQNMNAEELESTLLVSSLDLGGEARLLTLGRWCEGFLDLVQIFVQPGVPTQSISAALESLEGVTSVVGLTHDAPETLFSWLKAHGEVDTAQDLEKKSGLSFCSSHSHMLKMEQEVLGLVREDLASLMEVAEVFADTRNGDPMARRRVLEAARADILTTTALFHDHILCRLH